MTKSRNAAIGSAASVIVGGLATLDQPRHLEGLKKFALDRLSGYLLFGRIQGVVSLTFKPNFELRKTRKIAVVLLDLEEEARPLLLSFPAISQITRPSNKIFLSFYLNRESAVVPPKVGNLEEDVPLLAEARPLLLSFHAFSQITMPPKNNFYHFT